MADPKTTQERNEAVAKALGMTSIHSARPFYAEYQAGYVEFRPRGDEPTNIAAALWAFERWTQNLKPAEGLEMTRTPTLRCYPRLDGLCVWELQFDKVIFRGTFCEAIFRVIVGASK